MLSDYHPNQMLDLAEKYNLCPDCFEPLQIHEWREHRGEYWGVDCYENMAEWRCPNCK